MYEKKSKTYLNLAIGVLLEKPAFKVKLICVKTNWSIFNYKLKIR